MYELKVAIAALIAMTAILDVLQALMSDLEVRRLAKFLYRNVLQDWVYMDAKEIIDRLIQSDRNYNCKQVEAALQLLVQVKAADAGSASEIGYQGHVFQPVSYARLPAKSMARTVRRKQRREALRLVMAKYDEPYS